MSGGGELRPLLKIYSICFVDKIATFSISFKDLAIL